MGVGSLWPLGRGGQAGARCARGELGACQCRMKGVAGRGGEGPQPRCDFSERKLWREWLGGEEPLRKSFPAAGPPWAGRAGPRGPGAGWQPLSCGEGRVDLKPFGALSSSRCACLCAEPSVRPLMLRVITAGTRASWAAGVLNHGLAPSLGPRRWSVPLYQRKQL